MSVSKTGNFFSQNNEQREYIFLNPAFSTANYPPGLLEARNKSKERGDFP